MEEVQLPIVVQDLLLNDENYKSPKTKLIADRLRKNLFDKEHVSHDRKILIEAFNYFDSMFKANIVSSHKWQWELFLECFIYTAAYSSKKEMDDLKLREEQMIDKVKSISKKANELALLMREADGIGETHGFLEPDYDNPFELIVKSAETMIKSNERDECQTGCMFKNYVKKEIEKALTFEKKYRPATVNLIEELAYISGNEPIKYTSTTSGLLSDNHKFNIFMDEFFDSLDHLVLTQSLPKNLFKKEKYKFWVSIFRVVLGAEINEKTVGDAIRKYN